MKRRFVRACGGISGVFGNASISAIFCLTSGFLTDRAMPPVLIGAFSASLTTREPCRYSTSKAHRPNTARCQEGY